MESETYEEKKYLTEMSMHDCRMNFELRSRMFKCKMNFLNDPKYKSEMWRCDSCATCIDSQSHILYCPAYKMLREGKSLTSDQDIVDVEYQSDIHLLESIFLNKCDHPISACHCSNIIRERVR